MATVAVEESNADYEGWRVALASSIGVFFGFASVLVYTFGIFLKPISTEFGWSRQAVSGAFGIAAMMVAICSPLLGRLLDKYGPKRIIAPCIAVFACAFASLSLLTPNIWHLYAVFVVLGMVGNGTAQMAYARAVSTWFVARRGLALAVMMAGGASGAVLLPPLTQSLIDRLGWRQADALLGGLIILIGLPVASLFIRERGSREGQGSTVFTGATIGEGLRSRVFWLVVAILFVVSIAQNAAITHLPALLSDRGVSPVESALALSVMGVASLCGRLITGFLLDRYFAPYVSVALLLLSAAGTFLLSSATTFGTGCAAAALIGAGMGGEADVTPYLLSRYFGLRSFSTLYGFTWTAYAIAGALGPVMMGAVFDVAGSYQVFLAAVAGCTVVAGFLNFAMPAYSNLAVTDLD